MHKSAIFYPVVFIAIMTACTKGEKINPPPEEIRLAAVIEDNIDETRLSMGGDAGTTASFVANDKIGVYETLTGRSNVQYTYNGGSWNTTTPMYWSNGTSNHTFYAYYPYSSTASGTRVAIPLLSEQTMTNSPVPANDMLVSAAVTMKRAASAPLTFTHAFALLQLNIQRTLLGNAYTLRRITVQGGNTSGSSGRFGLVNNTNSTAKVGYDLVAGAITSTTNDSDVYGQSFYVNISDVPLLTTAATFYSFVLPGTYSNPVPAVSLNLALLGIAQAPTKFSPLTTNTFAPFQAGMKYVFTLTVGLLNRSSGETEILIEAEEPVPF